MKRLLRRLPQRYRLRLWLVRNYFRWGSFKLRRAQPSWLERTVARRVIKQRARRLGERAPVGVERLDGAVVINLDSRPDRLESFSREIARLGIQGVLRLPGTVHESGAIGCTTSHVRALDLMEANEWASMIVFEDDAQFVVDRSTLDVLVDAFLSDEHADVACLAYFARRSRRYNRLFRRGTLIQTTACYVVKRSILAELRAVWHHGIRELEAGGSPGDFIVDRVWIPLQRERVFLVPVIRTVRQESGFSDIVGRVVTYTH